MENNERKENNINNTENYRDNLLNELNNDTIVNAMLHIKKENFQKITHNIYVTICVIILFIGLFFLNYNSFIFSTLTILGIILLHFKQYILELMYEIINADENKKN